MLAISTASAALLVTPAAHAAFPGANGRIAYAGTTDTDDTTDIYTVLPDGSGVRQLTDRPPAGPPTGSPDGQTIAFTRLRGGMVEIWTMDADGGNQTHVADTGSALFVRPSFSPSGKRVLYPAGGSIHTVRPDGTDPEVLLAGRRRGPNYFEAVFSPNGKRIAFIGTPPRKKLRNKKGRGVMWSMRRDGSRLRRLSSQDDGFIDYSPDGRHIAFVRIGRRYGDRTKSMVMRSNGKRKRVLLEGQAVTTPVYAPAGDRIVIARAPNFDAFCSDLYTMTPKGTDLRRVTQNCDSSGSGTLAAWPSWQPLPE